MTIYQQIIVAGKRATPRPWTSVASFENGNKAYLAHGLKPIFEGSAAVADSDYAELAANHADKMAERLIEIREILAKAEPPVIHAVEHAGPTHVEFSLSIDDARKLSELLKEPTQPCDSA